jgi:outer membrane receptor protein involved in Fe transport
VLSEEAWFPQTDISTSASARGGRHGGLRPGFRQALTLSPGAGRRGRRNIAGRDPEHTAGNPDLKPERTTEFELGFDAGC